jgi:hypothetical protein
VWSQPWETDAGAGVAAGGICDPDTDQWVEIAAAPWEFENRRAWLAGDRVLMLGKVSPDVLGGAVYDVATETWIELPPTRSMTGSTTCGA